MNYSLHSLGGAGGLGRRGRLRPGARVLRAGLPGRGLPRDAEQMPCEGQGRSRRWSPPGRQKRTYTTVYSVFKIWGMSKYNNIYL